MGNQQEKEITKQKEDHLQSEDELNDLDFEPYLPTSEPMDVNSQFSPMLIMTLGFLVYVLANVYPPGILVVTAILAKMLPYMYRTNDCSIARRKAWKTWVDNDAPPIWHNPSDVVVEEEYWENSRGMVLMAVTTFPKDKKNIKGVICSCHGYSENASFLKRFEHRMFARAGYACVALEYEGHGRSDGMLTLINDLSLVVHDVSQYFDEKVNGTIAFKGKKVFLMGESMGGAVAYSCYNLAPNLFSGVIFYAPMLKIASELKPPQFVTDLLLALIGKPGSESWLGSLPISPTADVISHVFKETKIRFFSVSHPITYRRKPRLATSRELLHFTDNIEKSMHIFDAPFLLLHGLSDKVTDPSLSKEFYEKAKSNDKTLKLYDGMWHNLLHGEPKENTELVFSDIIDWMNKRC